MIERLPERAKSPAVARAMTSPSGLLLAGAGMSAAILGGLPLVAAAAVGVAAWAVRVAVAVPRKTRAERVDLSKLGDPWRGYVQDAMLAQAHFEAARRQLKPGPLLDRLTEVGRRLTEGVTECYKIALRGQSLDMAMMTLDIRRIQAELAACQVEQHRVGTTGQAPSPTLLQTMAALQAQLASAQRIQAVGADTRERLGLLNAQLDEAVAQAVELSVAGSDLDRLQPLTSDIENVVGELEALRQGLEELGGGTPRPATS